jgi:hypothetical protein
MRTHHLDRAIALAILGILLSLILAVLNALQAASAIILACSSFFALLILLLYVPVLMAILRDEERERRRLRRRRALRIVSEEEMAMPAALLTGHVYGYEQIFAVSGLRRNGPNAQLARLKPDRTDPNGFPYPLEIHVHEDKVHLVGFVERRHRHFADPTTTGDCLLWMRRTKGADTLITLALSRVIEEVSLGDRTDASANNIFRLALKLSGSAND